MTFALIAVPLVAVSGGGTDIYFAQLERSRLQSTLDAAVLAGSATQSEGEDGRQTVKDYLKKNFSDPTGHQASDVTKVDADKAIIESTASAKIQTSFLNVIGISEIDIQARSAATYGGQLTEVAIALDVTGSMNDGTKLADAKAAAKDLVDILFTVPGTNKQNEKVKIGVVPFASYVNVGTSARSSSWLDVPADYSTTTYSCQNESTCTGGYDKKTTTCWSDGIPYSCTQNVCKGYTTTNVCKDRTSTYKWYGCVGSRLGTADQQAEATSSSRIPGLLNIGCNKTLTRLTTNKGTVVSAIAGLSAGGETYIAPGVLWGWRVLSSKAPYGDGDDDPVKTRKAIVIMTDGANTLSANKTYHNGTNVTASNTMLATTCANAKAEKITIYTVAFAVTDTSIKKILTDCATSASYFFDSKNSAELKAAFNQIGQQLSSRRLVF